MILRLLISLLLTLGFADTSATVASTVQLGPDYQTEWVHSEKSDVRVYLYYSEVPQNTSNTIQAQLSACLSNELHLTFVRQQKHRLLISKHHQKQRALSLHYPSEESIYCLMA